GVRSAIDDTGGLFSLQMSNNHIFCGSGTPAIWVGSLRHSVISNNVFECDGTAGTWGIEIDAIASGVSIQSNYFDDPARAIYLPNATANATLQIINNALMSAAIKYSINTGATGVIIHDESNFTLSATIMT